MGNRVGSQELIQLGERVRQKRKDCHLSQETLAEKVGMDTLNKEIRKRSIFYEQIAGKENIDDSVMDMD